MVSAWNVVKFIVPFLGRPHLSVQEVAVEEDPIEPRVRLELSVGGQRAERENEHRLRLIARVKNLGSKTAKKTYVGVFQTYRKDKRGHMIYNPLMGSSDLHETREIPAGETVEFVRLINLRNTKPGEADAYVEVWPVCGRGPVQGAAARISVSESGASLQSVHYPRRSARIVLIAKAASRLPRQLRINLHGRKSKPFMELVRDRRKAIRAAKRGVFD